MGVIAFVKIASFRKKHTLPEEGKYATSPFLNSVLDLSIPELTFVSKYKILFPNK